MFCAADIKKAREAVRESQAAFGARFGVDQSTVHRWETDGPPERGPARKMIEREVAAITAASEGATAPAEPAE
jgi:DNA-binding transcriptional regulator YiaG